MRTWQGPRAPLAVAQARASAVVRWPITSVVFAGVVLAAPLMSDAPWTFRGATLPQIELVALAGVGTGWIVLDRLAARRVPLWAMAIVIVAVVGVGWLAARTVAFPAPGFGRTASTILAVAIPIGSLVRGTVRDRPSPASLVALAATASWLAYDFARLPYLPLRDLHLYVGAGATATTGVSPYLVGPLTSAPSPDQLPFVYPPLTIPLFELLAALPRFLVDAAWVGASIASVVAAMWLLGIRGRWLLVLLAWPPLALGIAVGNVASFSFLLYAVGFRVGAALILGGAFKLQSLIPALWLVRERRWRSIAVGVAILGVLALMALPLTGIHAWGDWLTGLRHFQETVTSFPAMQGLSLTRRLGPTVALAIAVGALGIAFIGRGRNGLARFGLASIAASPTLYLHGLSPLLAGALVLGPEVLWLALGLGWGPGFEVIWLTIALVGAALLVQRDDDLRIAADLSPSRADVHPAAETRQVWPASR